MANAETGSIIPPDEKPVRNGLWQSALGLSISEKRERRNKRRRRLALLTTPIK